MDDLPSSLHALASRIRRLTSRLDVEVALAVPVDGAMRFGDPLLLSCGGSLSVDLTPRQFLEPLLHDRAVAGVLVHTHCHAVGPSAADMAVTRRLTAAGHVVGVPLRAHLVVHSDGWVDCVSGTHGTWSAADTAA